MIDTDCEQAKDAFYGLLLETVRALRMAGQSEDMIRHNFLGDLHDRFRHTLPPDEYEHAQELIELAIVESGETT